MSPAPRSDADPGTKAQRVYRAVRDDILEGRTPSGTALDEIELAEAHAVSRTPVREALRLLQSDRLVEVGPRRQLRVIAFSAAHRRETGIVRAALECAAAADACRHRTEDDVDRLRLSVMRARRAADNDDTQRFFELDEEFHRELVALAQLPTLATLLEQLGAVVRLARFGLATDRSHLHGLADEHDRLLDLLEARDGDGLRAALDAHVRTTEGRTGGRE